MLQPDGSRALGRVVLDTSVDAIQAPSGVRFGFYNLSALIGSFTLVAVTAAD